MDDEVSREELEEWSSVPLPVLASAKVRCTGLKANGDRCKKEALPGMDRCEWHGGNTELARGQAAKRLEMVRAELFETLVDAASEAAEVYVGVMKFGAKDADRLKAADRVLQLLGIMPKDPVIMVREAKAETDDVDDKLRALLREATDERVREIIDVEVVEDDAE